MEQEDYCSYELALKLKACGFCEPCDQAGDCEYRLWKGKYRVMRNGDVYSPDGRKLKATVNPGGYCVLTPYINGKRYNKRVHQMVAEAWIPNPEGHPMINHINGNKQDNRVDNLEWCSASHNIKHAYNIGLKAAPNAREVVICETGQVFPSPRKMSDALGWGAKSCSHITALCRGNGKVRRKSVRGYTIRYYNPKPLVRKLIEAGYDKYPIEDSGDVFFCYLCLAQKWLRKVKRCDVTVYAQPYNGLPYYTGYILFEGDETEVLDDNRQWFDDYEKALSETIVSALELIEQEKE